MLTFAANLSWMFKEYGFLDRFAAAADAGFDTVEYLFPYEHDPDDIAARLARHKLKLALFNAPPGDFAKGDRGFACIAERRAEFRASIANALDYACVTGAPRLHLMAGIGAGEEALATYKQALDFACEEAGAHGIDILIEPLNPRDAPGYLLNDFALASRVIGELKQPNLKLQFDIYHRQIIHGDVLRGLEELLPITGHIQISSVPGRNEPSSGELNDLRVLKALEKMGYAGVIGCEYNPAGGTVEGLGWMDALR
jgi:hydroxypyruvate isomerase